MSLKNNTQSLQEVLEILSTKASGGEQATPEILINSSTGEIIATAGSKTTTYQMAFQAAKTITPSTVTQVAISSGHYAGGSVTVAGDSNLVASNIKSGVSIFGVNGTLQESSSGGNLVDYSENEDAIVAGTLSVYSNDRVEKVRKYAFCSCRSLTSVSFPVCTTIGGSAFEDCSSLTSVSFPACITIGNDAFSDCSSLTSVFFPACTSIEGYAFGHCNSLTSVSFPNCTTIGSYAFCNCSSLTSVSFPVCTTIRGSAFLSCRVLTSISFPVCTSIEGYAFRSCYCLSSLQFGASSICKLSNSNAFRSTPFTGYSASFSGTPHIYVPASLVSAYQSATNWTYFSSYFSAIETSDSGTPDQEVPPSGTHDFIEFTINGVGYCAISGMTWANWCNSDYNTGSYIADISVQLVFNAEYTEAISEDGHNPVDPAELVKAIAYTTI